jgi:Zn-dependent protease with chaperone function
MIQDGRDFESLIWDLERASKRDPKGYRFRVALVAGLGYAYVIGLLAVLTAVLYGIALLAFLWMHSAEEFGWFPLLVTSVPAIGVILIIRVVVEALIIDIEPPQGSELRRDVAPGLYKLVDELSEKLKAPHFHKVMISTDFNAGVAQYPRYGLFGKSLSYLWIGIPLIKALSPDELKAVLAHELGHVSGNHGKFGARIYGLNRAWATLRSGIKSKSRLVHPFIRWYVPYFNAYSFTLRRANEYEADRCAAELAGPQNAASALVLTEIYDRYLDEIYWPSVLKRAEKIAIPDASPFTNIFGETTRPTPEDAERWYREALDVKSSIDDTHPCLSERLAALGYGKIPPRPDAPAPTPVPLPTAAQQTAGDLYLGKGLSEYTQHLDNQWRHLNFRTWTREFEEMEERREEIRRLTDLDQKGELEAGDCLDLAVMTYWEDSLAGITLMQKYALRFPDNARIQTMLGHSLLENKDEAGVGHLEKGAVLDPSIKLNVCRRIARFYTEAGDMEKARPYDQYVKQHSKYNGAGLDRIEVKRTERLFPHGLPAASVAKLGTELVNMKKMKAAYLVQMHTRKQPQRPMFLLVIEPAADAFSSLSYIDSEHMAFEASRGLDLPGDVTVEVAYGRMKWIKEAARAVAGSTILEGF